MALELKGLDVPLRVDADIQQFVAVCVSATNENSVYLSTTECDSNCIGVLQDRPGAAGRAGQVRISGLTKMIAGETLIKGNKVGNADDTGLAKKPIASESYIGICLSGGLINELVTVFIQPGLLET